MASYIYTFTKRMAIKLDRVMLIVRVSYLQNHFTVYSRGHRKSLEVI